MVESARPGRGPHMFRASWGQEHREGASDQKKGLASVRSSCPNTTD